MLAQQRARWLIALEALGIACSRTRAPTERLSSRPSTVLSSRPERPASPKEAGPPPLETSNPEPRLDEGCTAGVAPSPGLVDTLKELARQCIASMRPLLEEPVLVELKAGTSGAVGFALADPAGCIRVAAVAERGLAELELRILDPDGGSHAVRALRGPLALLGPEGPVCFDRAGRYRVELRALRGSGRVAVNVWTAR
jgi:hypothetical protein